MRRTLPIEDKESFRWLKGYRLSCQLAAECLRMQFVSVADREADIDDIFVEAQQQTGPRADYIIRAKEDRSTPERDPSAGPAVYCKVRDEVSLSKLRATRIVELSQTPQRAARQSCLEIRAITVEVKPPHARSQLPSVTHNVVQVEEVGGTDVSWLLITTRLYSVATSWLTAIDVLMSFLLTGTRRFPMSDLLPKPLIRKLRAVLVVVALSTPLARVVDRLRRRLHNVSH